MSKVRSRFPAGARHNAKPTSTSVLLSPMSLMPQVPGLMSRSPRYSVSLVYCGNGEPVRGHSDCFGKGVVGKHDITNRRSSSALTPLLSGWADPFEAAVGEAGCEPDEALSMILRRPEVLLARIEPDISAAPRPPSPPRRPGNPPRSRTSAGDSPVWQPLPSFRPLRCRNIQSMGESIVSGYTKVENEAVPSTLLSTFVRFRKPLLAEPFEIPERACFANCGQIAVRVYFIGCRKRG